MHLLNLNVSGGFLEVSDGECPDLVPALIRALAELPQTAPVIILLHGYRYTPDNPRRNAHHQIFARTDRDLASRFGVSWPRGLGLARGPQAGLCIPVGWHALGGLSAAYERAGEVGQILSGLFDLLARLAPGRPVHVLAHSLGGRVALSALAAARHPVVRRLVLLAPAEFSAVAEAAMARPGAREVEVLQVSPAENRPFDLLFRGLLRRSHGAGPVLGGAAPALANWRVLPVDQESDLAHLDQMGHRIAPRQAYVCHWSSYLRSGLMELYGALLTGPSPLPLAAVARSVAAAEPSRSPISGIQPVAA